MSVHDLIGHRSGRLKVLKRATNDKHKKARWICACECGNQVIVGSRNLLTGLARSCGCLRREVSRQRRLSHGMTGTRAYNIYLAAKARCGRPANCNYEYYGGHGIQFLYTSFEEFFSDLGEPPPWGTVERCDNNGHYEPCNCRWASQAEQNNNKRSNVLLTAFGRTQTTGRWAREFNIHSATLRGRVENGWSVEKAFTAPPRRPAP